MTALWRRDGERWEVLTPAGFPDEATLHTLVERDPYLLPLAGSPRIAVVGREVRLGTGYADLLAVEEEGRLVVIEIKLARNAEARRAVVAQVLAYASELQRLTPDMLESDVLGAELKKRGHASLFDAARKVDQTGSLDEDAFRANLGTSLAQGRIRLVLVLDAAPPELVRLSSYLRLVAEGRVLLDLITLSSYSVGGTDVLVPQRVDGEDRPTESEASSRKSVKKGELSEGSAAFEQSISSAPAAEQARLVQLLEWARSLESEGLVSLQSYRGIADRWILLPRLVAEGAGLVSIWNDGRATLQVWRSVFEAKAPEFIERVEASIAGPIKQGGNAKRWDAATLELLTAAYRRAAGK